jgi:hypothetical protein
MTTITFTDAAVQTPFDDVAFDGAQLAAVSFLARYSGRTLEAYRQDLRDFFQWARRPVGVVQPRTSCETSPSTCIS